MIADALRFDVELFAAHTRETNPFFRRAEEGRLTPENVGRYLVSLRHMIAETPAMLARARRVAIARGHAPLAEHYLCKDAEEAGHDVWASEDLRVLTRVLGVGELSGPAPAMLELCDYLRAQIDVEPSIYLAYMLFAEYFTVLVGGEFIQHIVNRCGIPIEAMSCLAKHVELDQAHTDEGLDVIDALVADPRMLGTMREVLAVCFGFFDRFGEELIVEHVTRVKVEEHAELRIAV